MELHYKQELETMAQCVHNFSYGLSSLLRMSTALRDPDIAMLSATTQVDIANLSLEAQGVEARILKLVSAMQKTAQWNEVYKQAYGMNCPEFDASER